MKRFWVVFFPLNSGLLGSPGRVYSEWAWCSLRPSVRPSAGILHGAAEETARQIRGLSYKVFIVTW